MKKVLLWGGAALLLVLLAGVLIVANLDWNRARPWLNARIGNAVGRPFAIRGNLSVEWRRPAVPAPGWRGWVPHPLVSAGDLRIGPPEWQGSAPDTISVDEVRFSLDLLPLLARKVVVSSLSLRNSSLNLERRLDGRNNWTFGTGTPPAWRFEIRSFEFGKANVHLVDAMRHADLVLKVDSLAGKDAERWSTGWKVDGRYNGEAIRGRGRAGTVLSLQAQAEPFPIEAAVHVGKTSIGLRGTLTRPSDVSALDVHLKLSGASMAQLFPIIGVPLPETPAYATEGHLSGILNPLGGDWTYEKFSGTVGSSDLSGTLAYKSRLPRPLLEGAVVSGLLKFADLAPVIGADTHRGKAERGVADAQPAGKMLPVEPFKTDRWRSVDVDVKFTGRRIVRDKALPIDHLVTRVKVDDGVLSLLPLDFGVAGGSLNSNIRLNGRAAPVRAEMKISARGLRLKDLFPTIPSMHASLGAIDGDAALSGSGDSVARLLGSANGDIKASISSGTISKLLLDEIGLNIGNVVLTRIFGDKEVRLRCASGDFSVTRGVMQTRSVVIDTERAVLTVEGRIDLAREQLDLTLKPVSKSVRLISFTGPLYVTGPFSSPEVSVDKGLIALKAAGAVALAVLAPVAALIPLTTIGRADDGDCRSPPSASKPGSRTR